MDARERISLQFARRAADRPGFWMGQPVEKTLERYLPEAGVSAVEELAVALDSDMLWYPAEWPSWQPPDGRPLWPEGALAACETAAEVERYDWPDPRFLDFTHVIGQLRRARLMGRFTLTGNWTYLFQILADLFGMETLFCHMMTEPAPVDAAVERVTAFYLEANETFFRQAGDLADAFFFANDLGTQLDLLLSPALIARFLFPSFSRFIQLAKRFGKPVVFHSCGAIRRIIPSLIDLGIDALHPLQAGARDMDAASLAAFRDDLVLIGGVDTQRLLPFGTPEDVRRETGRIRALLGDRYIASPSHEGVLPDIPLENLRAIRGCL